MCLGYYRSFDLPLTVLRFALVVADDEILNFAQFYLSHWLKAYQNRTSDTAQAIYQQLAGQQAQDALLVARDENGRSYKKHIADVNDIVRGILSALDKPAAFGQVFQLAGPAPFTWEEVIPYLAQKLGRDYIDVKLAELTPTYYEFDLAKGRRLLGFQPQMDIFKMIDQALAFREAGR
jgi:UDP-glucose 4-epimerase